MKVSDLDKRIVNNPKVKIFSQKEESKNIGYIKNNAFHLGTGDVLVEVDHDDLLTSDCLQELNIAFKDESVGFVYSDNAILDMKKDFVPFNKAYGWTHSHFDWDGRKLVRMHSFKPTSQSLSYVWFAPDHVRAWRSSVYKSIGGHDKTLSVCDDHDLCIRTYLHSKMKKIDKCLYLYRITGENTWLKRNELIQKQTVELFNKYARRLAEKDADDKNLLKLDIGCGSNPHPGYKTLDLKGNVDILHDLNNGIPLPDNSVGVISASHIIEHLHDKNKIMSEIHRVLCHGGWAFIEVPSTEGRGAFQDPTHVSYWNENSFLYYTNSYLAGFIDNKNIRFQKFRLDTYYPNDWMKNLKVLVTSAWLVAIKDDSNRLPGLLEI